MLSVPLISQVQGQFRTMTSRKPLRNALGTWSDFSLPEWMLKIGGKVIGTEPYLILDGRRIIPARLVDAGFKFQYSHIEPALNDLFKREA